MKVAVVNLKGGVGKTVTSVHLAAELGRRGGRTVLVDGDPQGSAVTWAQLAPDLPYDTVPLHALSVASGIGAAGQGYAHLVVDTPPGDLGVVRRALQAVETVLVPVQPTLQDLNRLRPTLEVIAAAESHGPALDVAVVMTRVRAGTRGPREARSALEAFGLRVLETEIPLLEAYAWEFGSVPRPEAHYGELLAELMAAGVAA